MSKIIICTILLIGVCQASKIFSQTNDKHNIHVCSSEDPTDWTLAVNNKFTLESHVLPQKRTFTYPINDIRDPIKCINVTDLSNSNYGGYPKIIDGGVDEIFVKLEFRSQPLHGFNFLVQIWQKWD